MNPDERMLELLTEMILKQEIFIDEMREMKGEMREMKGDMREMKGAMFDMRTDIHEMKGDIRELNGRVDSLEKQQALTNLSIGELRHSVMSFGSHIEVVMEHEKRLDRLEQKVFH